MRAHALLLTAAVAVAFAAPAAQAHQAHRSAPAALPGLTNLTTSGATTKAGDARCPDQPYYLYSGGKQDAFAGAPEPTYPSPSLAAFFPPGAPTVPYDIPMNTGQLEDSFNLQNTRGVCYAVIQFRTAVSGATPTNDALTIGHVDPGPGPYNVVAQVTSPGTGSQSYALTSTGLSLLSDQTGYFLNKAPAQSVLDLYLADSTRLDFFRMYVWYGPNCSQTGAC